MNKKSGTSQDAADKLVKGIRRKTRKQYSAEEKIRIVLAALREGERVVINHTDWQAFLRLYLCRPEHRGRGIGLGLLRSELTHARARSVGLDVVPAHEENYARSGFGLTGRTSRLGGLFASLFGAAAFAGDALAQGGDTARLIELDAAANGYSRPR